MNGNTNIRSFLYYVTMSILMFGYIYQVPFTFMGIPEQIHSSRIAVAIFIIIYVFKGFPKNKCNSPNAKNFLKKLFYLHIMLFAYMLLLYCDIGIKDGEHMVVILLNFIVSILIPAFILSNILDSLDDFFKVVLYATLIQTVIVWICILSPSISAVVDLLFNHSERFLDLREGYAGGIGCIAAPGYIKYSLGQIACLYFVMKTKKTIYILLYLLMVLTGAMIARTGLFGGILGTTILLYFSFIVERKKIKILPIIIISLLVIIVLHTILSNSSAIAFFGERFARMGEMVSQTEDKGFFQQNFFYSYLYGKDNILPPISYETIIGTGVPSGVAGNGIKVNIDGGYLRVYVAYGLILAIFFYLYLFGKMFKIAFKEKILIKKYILILFGLMLIIAEFKEWSVYGSTYVCFFCVAAMLPIKESLIAFEK